VLAGFYTEPLSFAFAPAFMREAQIRVPPPSGSARPAGREALAESGRLSLDGLITHHDEEAAHADRRPTAPPSAIPPA
jgi:3-hydroxyethyl bacteriochlorophyllide a dehydrogenase